MIRPASVSRVLKCLRGTILLLAALMPASRNLAGSLELARAVITPHVRAESMRSWWPPRAELSARVQVFLRNHAAEGSPSLVLDKSTKTLFDGRTPEDLLANGQWAWHDTPHAMPDERVELPPGAMTVWTFNGKSQRWGVGHSFTMTIGDSQDELHSTVSITRPTAWLSAVTFLASDADIRPDTAVVHVANESSQPLCIASLRLWLPKPNASYRVVYPQERITHLELPPGDGRIPPHDKGMIRVRTGKLPLTYAAVEVECREAGGKVQTLWTHLRIKREAFDISGGWVGDHARQETFLKLLKFLYVNTAHLTHLPGYTDIAELYGRYPLKYFGSLMPVERFDTDAVLPRIHAVESLGEPQYGDGHPVPPQVCWAKLHPYAPTRLPTSLTHSNPFTWHLYAGLSDYPHYDAYRVSAPAVDSWRKYDRWGSRRIGWGAPLETIGDMTRALREVNRPAPCAYWSQGPHAGWEVYGGRQRTSPTPDELRLEAYHALSNRITSLYWFNLSLESLLKFPDTWGELRRIGREMRLLEDFYLQGDAYRCVRTEHDGKLDWDLASIAAPQGALLFALDLDYVPDPTDRVFKFASPRQSVFPFALPSWLQPPAAVFAVDADGIRAVKYDVTTDGVRIVDKLSRVGIYVATRDPKLREDLAARHKALLRKEQSLGFDPLGSPPQMEELKNLAKIR